MANRVEPMEIEEIDSEFDNKENAYHNNMIPTKPNIEKGYEELDISETNMRLRYSITPSSSPMSKSFTAVCTEGKGCDKFENMSSNTIVNDTYNLTQSWGPINCPTETTSLIFKNTSGPHLSPCKTDKLELTSDSTVSLSDNLVNNKHAAVCIKKETDKSAYPSSSSSPLPLNMLVPDSSSKEMPKSSDSPIMRGLKSVFNIFRSSQSPIPLSNTDKIPESIEEDQEVILSPDIIEREIKTNHVLASTPIYHSRAKEENGSKRNSPYKDSIVFNNDLVNELQWNNETTILFSDEKIPLHKLLLQRAHSSTPDTSAQIVQNSYNLTPNIPLTEDEATSDLNNILLNDHEPRNNGVMQTNFVLPYVDKDPIDSLDDHQEDDSEFLDCENTFINNDLNSQSVDPTIKFDEYPKNNLLEDSNVKVKKEATSGVFEKVLVSNIVNSNVVIGKQLSDDAESNENEIINQNNLSQDKMCHDSVKSQDDFKSNEDKLLTNFCYDMQISTSDCKVVCPCSCEPDNGTVDLNFPNTECVLKNEVQSLKQMAFKIVHAEQEMIETEKEMLNNDLLKGNYVPSRNTANDSVLKFEMNEGDSSEKGSVVTSIPNIEHAQDIEVSEIKTENLSREISILNNKFDATFLTKDRDCSNKNDDECLIKKGLCGIEKIEEIPLFSENISPYIFFKAEDHNNKDVPVPSLKYKSITQINGANSLHHNSNISHSNIEDNSSSEINKTITLKNKFSSFEKNQLLDSTMISLINTATDIVENTIQMSIQTLENKYKINEKTLCDGFGVNLTHSKATLESIADEEKIAAMKTKASKEKCNLDSMSAKSKRTGEEIKLDFDNVALNDYSVGNDNDIKVGALDSLVCAATEIVTNVVNMSTQYIETFNEVENPQKPSFVTGTIIDAQDVNNEVRDGNTLALETNAEVDTQTSEIAVPISSNKNEVDVTINTFLTSRLRSDFMSIHDSPSHSVTQYAKQGLETDYSEDKMQMCDNRHCNNDCIINQGIRNNEKENLSFCSYDSDVENKDDKHVGALATLINTATDVVVKVISSSSPCSKEIIEDTNHIADKNVVDNNLHLKDTENTNFPDKIKYDNCNQENVNIKAVDACNEIVENKNDSGNDALKDTNENDTKLNGALQEETTIIVLNKNLSTALSTNISPVMSNEKEHNAITFGFNNYNYNHSSHVQQYPAIIDAPKITYEHNVNECPSDLCQPDSQIIQTLCDSNTHIIEKNDTEIHQSIEEEQLDFNIDSDNSKESESQNNTIKEQLTEEEDTVEGPFLDTSNSIYPAQSNLSSQQEKKDSPSKFSSDVLDLKQFSILNGEDDQNHESSEVFIDADAFEFFMNQNGNDVVGETGKESLFLKFDPLCANKVDASGVAAILSKMENTGSTVPKPETPSNQLPGSATVTCNSGDINEDLLTTSISQKPVMAVPPAVHNEASLPHINRLVTPTRPPRQTNLSSPAIAIIDRLISISANTSPVQGSNFSPDTRRSTESETILIQLKEALDAKERDIQQLRIESGELKERLCNFESHMNRLEKDNEEKLRKINELNETLVAKTKMNKNMAAVVEEYERTIAGLIAESEQEKKLHEMERVALMRERDEQTAHLGSMEVSFGDLHSKYEKSKQIILSYKVNEDKLRKSIADFEDTFKKMQSNYDLLKQHATSKLNAANQEFHKVNKAHEAELLKFNAMIKRKELHITSLEETLSQKIKANEELTAICDELINKVA